MNAFANDNTEVNENLKCVLGTEENSMKKRRS